MERLVRQGSAPFGSITLDDLDRAILLLLREDGRRSNADIAREVGVSQPTVRQRLDRILRGGAAYVTVRINPAAIGFPIDVILNLRVSGRDVREVGEEISALEHVSYVGYTIGSCDIQVEAFLRDNDHLFRFVTEVITPIEGVASVETFLVMRTEKFNYKWEGEALGSTDETPTGDPGEYAVRRLARESAASRGAES